jgi:hypothetical protein
MTRQSAGISEVLTTNGGDKIDLRSRRHRSRVLEREGDAFLNR